MAPIESTRPPVPDGRYDRAMKFHHLKLLALDIYGLAEFYREALGCETVMEPTEIDDPGVGRAIGSPGSRILLTFLRLPAYEAAGPLLEIYTFGGKEDRERWPFRPGQAHLSFQVEDLDAAAELFTDSGGDFLGQIAEWSPPGGGARVRFVYLRDPEGNLVDLAARAKSVVETS